MFTHVLLVITLFFLMLVCGVFWGLYFSLSRSYHVFEAHELARIARVIVGNLEVPMRNISIVCLILMISSAISGFAGHHWQAYLMAGSTLLIIASLVITTAIEVPINNQVVTWTEDNVPDNWQQLRNRWQRFNLIRTISALLSFLLFGVAVVF